MLRFSSASRLASEQYPASADSCSGLRPRLISIASVIGISCPQSPALCVRSYAQRREDMRQGAPRRSLEQVTRNQKKQVKNKIYLVHLITRNSFGLMTRKLSVTESQRSAQFRGTFSRRKLSVASANWAHVA